MSTLRQDCDPMGVFGTPIVLGVQVRHVDYNLHLVSHVALQWPEVSPMVEKCPPCKIEKKILTFSTRNSAE